MRAHPVIATLSASAGTLAVGAALALSLAAPASAQEVCDAYSGTCTEPPAVLPTSDTRETPDQGGTGTDRTRTGSGTDTNGTGSGTDTNGSGTGSVSNARPAVQPAGTPTTLPFTGGELVLFSALGAGAVAGGAALVVAGRRRSQPAS